MSSRLGWGGSTVARRWSQPASGTSTMCCWATRSSATAERLHTWAQVPLQLGADHALAPVSSLTQALPAACVTVQVQIDTEGGGPALNDERAAHATTVPAERAPPWARCAQEPATLIGWLLLCSMALTMAPNALLPCLAVFAFFALQHRLRRFLPKPEESSRSLTSEVRAETSRRPPPANAKRARHEHRRQQATARAERAERAKSGSSVRRGRAARPLFTMASFMCLCSMVAAGSMRAASMLGARGCAALAGAAQCSALAAHRAADALANSPYALIHMTLPWGAEQALPNARHTRDEVHGWVYGNHPGMTDEHTRALRDALVANKASFAYTVADLPGYSGGMGPYRITLDSDYKILTPPRRHSQLERSIQDEKCAELKAANIVRPIELTDFASAPTMPAKKDAHGNWTEKRFCIDFRKLNEHTLTDHAGPPLPEQLFQDIGEDCIFSKLDLRAGFHQIPVHPDDQPKTTFWWGNKTYCFNRLPFGLKNATAYFQRVMDYEIARAQLQDNVKCFVDDVLIHSRTPAEHVQHVTRVPRHDIDL